MDWFRDQMKKGMNPRTYLLVGVLLAVLVWIHSLDVKQRALRARAGVPASSALAAPAPARAVGTLASAPEQGTPAGWGSDPFERRVLDAGETAGKARPAPRPQGAPARSGLFLQGIMNGPLGPTALINGDIVREGQRIGSREVIQIGRRSVLILDHGTVLTLTLKGDGS